MPRTANYHATSQQRGSLPRIMTDEKTFSHLLSLSPPLYRRTTLPPRLTSLSYGRTTLPPRLTSLSYGRTTLPPRLISVESAPRAEASQELQEAGAERRNGSGMVGRQGGKAAAEQPLHRVEPEGSGGGVGGCCERMVNDEECGCLGSLVLDKCINSSRNALYASGAEPR